MTVSPDGMNLKYQHKIGLLWKPYVLKGRRYEEFAMKIERFIHRVEGIPDLDLKGVKRTAGWLDHQDVCLKLKISKRTLQTLRDNGTLAYTKIGNRTYYLPEDVERIVTKVEDRRKDARYRGHTI